MPTNLTNLSSLRDMAFCQSHGPTRARHIAARCVAWFRRVNRMPQLTSLCLSHKDNIVTIPSLDFTTLAQLVGLTLHGVIFDTPTIRAIAALPRLRSLAVNTLEPDRDLNDLACSFTKLELRSCNSPQQLAWMPLRNVQLLLTDDPCKMEWWSTARRWRRRTQLSLSAVPARSWRPSSALA
jgi:hypothetical protein